MKKAVWSGIIAAVGVLALSTPAFAQPTTATVNVNATVAAKAKLTVSAAAISFADQDPDVVAQIAANTPLDITVKARTTAGSPVSLTVQAGGDLVDGSNSIAISALKWTSTTGSGNSFNATGTSSTSGATVVAFSGSGTAAGTQSYTLDNSWAYATGTYLATLTYTLSAP